LLLVALSVDDPAASRSQGNLGSAVAHHKHLSHS
jgi:hypothetical protein